MFKRKFCLSELDYFILSRKIIFLFFIELAGFYIVYLAPCMTQKRKCWSSTFRKDISKTLVQLQIKMEDAPLTGFLRDSGCFHGLTEVAVFTNRHMSLQVASLAGRRNLGWESKWPTRSPLPQQLTLNRPGARHLTPCLYRCSAATSTRLIAVQLPGVNVA